MARIRFMSADSSGAMRFRWCGLAATAVLLLSLTPQLHLWLTRGSQWQGAYATQHGDEFLYSAYVNALINGRPRRNDPFSGQDNQLNSRLPETTFSIQVVPSTLITFFARVFGVTASTAFIVLSAVSGLLASLSLFWLLSSITGSGKLALAGVLVVLCCAALVGAQGIVGALLKQGVQFLGFPFLRRYQPAATFPLFFVFCALTWLSLTSVSRFRARLNAVLAGLTLATLIFSYLYLWTASVAWLLCLAVPWLCLMHKRERVRSLEVLGIVTAISICALVPFIRLVSNRAESLDVMQTLTLTRQPDLLRIPELLGAVTILALIVGLRRRSIAHNDPRVIFAASFALLPFAVFNQQILTGRILQSYHYEVFIANYAVLVGLVITAFLLWQRIPKKAALSIGILCFFWGAVEVGVPTMLRATSDTHNDQMVPVLLRLNELSQHSDTLPPLGARASSLVFSPEIELLRLVPTWTPHGTSLAIGGVDFGSVSRQENKESLYSYLYFSGRDSAYVRDLLGSERIDSFLEYLSRSIVFGHERVVPFLGNDFKPVTTTEVDSEVRVYEAFVAAFSREDVLKRPIQYLVTRAENDNDLSNLHLWYERDAGERVGEYDLYRLTLRR